MEWFDFGSLRGRQHAVLFFYPRDGTPYCTLEAADFPITKTTSPSSTAWSSAFRATIAFHTPISATSTACRFACSRTRKATCAASSASCQYRERDGHKKLFVIRSTFMVDKDGIVRHALYDVNPKGHAAEVYQLVKGLNGKGKHHAHR
jgi:peroxiredoxin Q/BCP